jgi:hypothetical protein
MAGPHFDSDFFRAANSLISDVEGLLARILFGLAAVRGIYLSLFAPKKPPS